MPRVFLCLLLLMTVFFPVRTAQSAPIPQDDTLPSHFDWRAAGVVTPVREQGGCQAARVFAATAMLESAILIAGGARVDLSEQYLLNCSDRAASCTGAGGWDVLDFYQDAFLPPNTQPGAVLESAMPYRGRLSACARASQHPYRIERWGTLSDTQASVEQIQRALLTYGPLAIGVCAWSAFASYSGGLFDTDESLQCAAQGLRTNYIVTVVGWDNPGGYWIIKNAMGKDWGEDGYMLLAYGISNAGFDSAYLVYGAPPPTPALIAPSAGALLPLGEAELRWKAAPGAQAYRLQVAADAAFSSLVLETESSQAQYLTPDLPSNRVLWWRVSACRTVDAVPRCSAWSSPRAFKTRPLTPLPTRPMDGAWVDSLRCRFEWQPPDDATRFDVQIASDADFKKNLRSVTVSGAAYTPASDLPRARNMYWRVRARGRYGVSAWSAARDFITPDPPAAPRLVAPAGGALLPAGVAPVLRWNAPVGAAGYRVQVAHSQSFAPEEIWVETSVGEPVYPLALPLAPDALYYWRVRAVGLDGALSNWSAPRSLKTRPDAPIGMHPGEGALVGSLRPLFTWQNGSARFEVQIARGSGCANLLRGATVTGAQYQPTSNLPRAAALSWRVRARGRWGAGAWSACQGFQTPP